MDPPRRSETVRQRLRDLLITEELTAKQLSQQASVRENEVLEHLEHLERSLRREDRRLVVVPARCLACDFEYKKRERLRKPRRCVVCGSERVAPPSFRIESSAGAS